MKTTRICVRGASERVKLEGGGERHVVSPRKWKFDDGSAQRKKEEGESEAHPYYIYARSARAESKKQHLESFNRDKSKKSPRDLSRHAADLRYRENARFLMVRGPARNIDVSSEEMFRTVEKSTTLKKLT